MYAYSYSKYFVCVYTRICFLFILHLRYTYMRFFLFSVHICVCMYPRVGIVCVGIVSMLFIHVCVCVYISTHNLEPLIVHHSNNPTPNLALFQTSTFLLVNKFLFCEYTPPLASTDISSLCTHPPPSPLDLLLQSEKLKSIYD